MKLQFLFLFKERTHASPVQSYPRVNPEPPPLWLSSFFLQPLMVMSLGTSLRSQYVPEIGSRGISLGWAVRLMSTLPSSMDRHWSAEDTGLMWPPFSQQPSWQLKWSLTMLGNGCWPVRSLTTCKVSTSVLGSHPPQRRAKLFPILLEKRGELNQTHNTFFFQGHALNQLSVGYGQRSQDGSCGTA